MSNLTGQSIGRYHILEQLGEGGMATVYRAYDTRLERNVAVKVLRTDQFIPAELHTVLQRFEREAKSLAKLSHPNIVHILDFGEHEEKPFLVMEYLPGGTLKQRLGQAIPWQETFRTLLPVARGLAYAHQHNLIHRDVKPANILMDEFNAPILTDFGIAKLLEGADGHTLTASGVGIGTPEYMAPEQGIGAHTIDARADVYSLGIVLYEMVTGRKPYIADTPMAVVLKQMTDPLPRPTDFVPDLPENVEHILFKALAKQPEDRYVDMNALISAMESMLAEAQKIEVSVPVKRLRKRAAPRAKPSPKVAMAIVGALAAILVIAFGGSWVIKRFSAESEAGATSTKVSDVSSPTFTLLPPAKTLEPSPSPTHTLTPRPTSTATPTPDWVVNFTEPILKAISDRPPTYEDDFSNPYSGWYNGQTTGQAGHISGEKKYDNGEYVVIANGATTKNPDVCSGGEDQNVGIYADFVAEFDVRFASDTRVHEQAWIFNFHMNEIGFYAITLWRKISLDDPIAFQKCILDDCSALVSVSHSGKSFHVDGNWNHILLIVHDTRMAAYVNGVPTLYLDDVSAPTKFGKGYFSVNSCNNAATILETRWDNFRVWDISNLP